MLLDTCALLWLAQGGGKLTRPTLEAINNEPIVYVSAISGFEIGLKYIKQKLSLPEQPATWFKKIIQHHDLTVLAVDLDICVASTMLPMIHADPCDRFIIACAEINRLTVVTADEKISDYGIHTIC